MYLLGLITTRASQSYALTWSILWEENTIEHVLIIHIIWYFRTLKIWISSQLFWMIDWLSCDLWWASPLDWPKVDLWTVTFKFLRLLIRLGIALVIYLRRNYSSHNDLIWLSALEPYKQKLVLKFSWPFPSPLQLVSSSAIHLAHSKSFTVVLLSPALNSKSCLQHWPLRRIRVIGM